KLSPKTQSKHRIIEEVCHAVSDSVFTDARNIIAEQYPFKSLVNDGRHYTDYQKTKIFLRDGFLDRYSGEKLYSRLCYGLFRR
ncbi:MAG: hypothetical protein ACYSVY_22530, partial [Planctomycetota bacterium]